MSLNTADGVAASGASTSASPGNSSSTFTEPAAHQLSPEDTLMGSGSGEEREDGAPVKKKRGSKACSACRKVKMRCIPMDPPAAGEKCRRCVQGRYDCHFLESQRGRGPKAKARASDAGVTDKLARMQATLDSVLLRASAGPIASPLPAYAPDPFLPTQTDAPSLSLEHSSSSLHLPSTTYNPHLLDIVSSELEGLEGGTVRAASESFASLGFPTESVMGSPGKLARVTKQAKGQAGSFAGHPLVRFPMPTLAKEPKTAPALLLEKVVTIEEVQVLFDLFFDFLQPQAPFLDRQIHTPTYAALHAPFLFTCICTVASKYLPGRPGLYARCRATALRLAADHVFAGLSSISIVQGCLILSHWNQPGFPGEGDRSFLFTGIALRMSVELGLHIKPELPVLAGQSDELRRMFEKDARNRERTWINCVVSDQTLSLQMGKPRFVTQDGYLMRNAISWSRHPLAIQSDVGICSNAAMHAINAQTIDALYSNPSSVTGFNESVDHRAVLRVFLAQTNHWRSSTLSLLSENTSDTDVAFKRAMTTMYFSYYRVFFLSFGIQHAQGAVGKEADLAFYVLNGYECAVALIQTVSEQLGDTGRLRYGMDSTFVFLTSCATFLLKLIHPTFSALVDPDTALSFARDAATLLEKAAVDESHTPAVYATFLRSLIHSKVTGDRSAAPTRHGSRAGSPVTALLPDLTASLEDILQAHVAEERELVEDPEPLDSKFWENMIMPGFGGQLGTLRGGHAMLSEVFSDGWGEPGLFPGMLSGAASPEPFSDYLFTAE